MTTTSIQLRSNRWWIAIGFILILVFRWEVLLADVWVNWGLVAFKQYPFWQTAPVDKITNDATPVSPFLQHAARYRVENVTLARGWGLLLFVQGREDEATAVWQAAGLAPAEATIVQGYYAHALNHPQAALTWYEHTIKYDPSLAAVWHTLGNLYAQNEQVAAAKVAYKQAVDLGNAASADPLARLWRDEGNLEAAIGIWQATLDTFPDHQDRLRWWQGLTNSLRAINDWEMGIILVEKALQEFPEDAGLYVEKGAIIYGLSGDAPTAMEAIHMAIDLDQTVTGAYSTAAGIMAAEQHYRAAYDWYTEAILRNPQNASWYVARGHMARADGNFALALDAFLEAVDRFPGFAQAHFGLATVYKQLDQKEAAAAAVSQALLVTESKNVQDYLRAAEIYEWSGYLDEAVAAYQQVLLIEPKNDKVIQALQELQNK
jgi:tetratricopeptide (TPR) repeat protein